MSRNSDYDWSKTRVWWSAKHKWTGMVHLAATIGNGKITRCGLRIYKNGKQFKLYEWAKHGNSPITPTCGHCLKLRKYDLETQWSAKFSGGENGNV